LKAGIICEYDPFHKGHDYHLAKTLQAMPSCSQNAVIAVMSGNYVQRAQPAMWDKFTRTRMALSSGVSMVLELPTLYAAATAEWFAFGGVSLLYHSHMIDALSFGMEDESHLPVLKRASSLLFPEDPAYQTLLRRYLSEPLPFAQARQRALEDLLGQALPTGPNDVLVLEYLKAIRRLEEEENTDPGWKLIPVTRKGSGHDQDVSPAEVSGPDRFLSARSVRRLSLEGQDISPYLPHGSLPYLRDKKGRSTALDKASYERFYAYLIDQLARIDAAKLSDIDEVAEGLENRLISAPLPTPSYSKFLDLIKTKRYPTSRLNRILLNITLGISRSFKNEYDFAKGPSYIRVLGVRKDQLPLLSELTHKADLPVIINPARQMKDLPDPARDLFRRELTWSRIYASLSPAVCQNELSEPLLIV